MFVTIFPWGCTEFPENSLSFPGSQKSLSIPGLWPPCTINQSIHQRTPQILWKQNHWQKLKHTDGWQNVPMPLVLPNGGRGIKTTKITFYHPYIVSFYYPIALYILLFLCVNCSPFYIYLFDCHWSQVWNKHHCQKGTQKLSRWRYVRWHVHACKHAALEKITIFRFFIFFEKICIFAFSSLYYI